ncbi:MAG: PadR family transcriptional regulator [Sulfobacillus acidophilus]|uniref:PadR family transcriptional regulator n=1 Tax=Sulfobacillus acidophilus TaxID=53633 RepID=A0A2T2WD44_9FIRM|nr:MAG: PadR family transcriptional regulator [Sulfobacillus acidophilus]
MPTRTYQTGKHLEAFILLIVAREPLHGGAIISRLQTILPSVWTIDDGHVYRVLRNLESTGALSSDWVTESVGAPVRVYHITPLGQERLVDWKEEITLRVQSLQTFLDLWEQSFS